MQGKFFLKHGCKNDLSETAKKKYKHSKAQLFCELKK